MSVFFCTSNKWWASDNPVFFSFRWVTFDVPYRHFWQNINVSIYLLSVFMLEADAGQCSRCSISSCSFSKDIRYTSEHAADRALISFILDINTVVLISLLNNSVWVLWWRRVYLFAKYSYVSGERWLVESWYLTCCQTHRCVM